MTMHAHIDAAGNPNEPGKFGEALRGAGRILARLFGLATIAAAGVAGWFGIEHYVFPEVPGTFAASETPWPAEFDRPAPAWDSFALSYQLDGIETHQIAFDATAGITRLAYRETSSAATGDVELRGVDAFERSAGAADWTPVDPSNVDAHVVRGVLFTQPLRLSTMVPSEARPFATFTESGDVVDGVRRFDVVIDAPAFLEAEPVAFYRWFVTRSVAPTSVEELRWTVDVRPDGYIVRWEGRTPIVEVWSEFPTDLEFESPLASSEPAEPTTLPPDETAVPTTVGE